MHGSDICFKTALGLDEVRKRSAKLPQRLRTVLILVDGSLRVSELQQAAATLGAPPDCLDTLLQQGLVAIAAPAARPLTAPLTAPLIAPLTAPSPPPARLSVPSPADSGLPAAPSANPPAAPELPSAAGTDAERFRLAVKFMNVTAVDALGLRAFFFTLKLEKCGTQADLLALLPDYLRLVQRGSGQATAMVLEARLRKMLS